MVLDDDHHLRRSSHDAHGREALDGIVRDLLDIVGATVKSFVTNSSVRPSPGVAAVPVPTTPLAPVRFSTKKFWPRLSEKCCATTRGQHVGRAASRVGYDDADLPLGIGRRASRLGRSGHRPRTEHEHHASGRRSKLSISWRSSPTRTRARAAGGAHQRFIARLYLALDRQHVRTPDEYLAIARRYFSDASATVLHDLIAIPYTICTIEARVT
jgi:hypothetical protein